MNPVIRRKFEIPELPGLDLVRERLAAKLREGLAPSRQFTLVIGGPGTGKSHLVAAYARTAPLVVWYRLTSADRDPLVFATHLLAGLGERLGFLSERPDQILAARGAPALAAAFGLLCDELASGLGEPLVLAIDECHHLSESPYLKQGLEALVQFFPESSQLLLAGRSFDALDLAGCESRDELVVVGDRDLAFTRDDVAALIAVASGEEPNSAEVQRLFERTRGWAIAVAHAARHVRHPWHTGVVPPGSLDQPDCLHAYLAQEVFPELPAAFRRQLLACCHLSPMDEAACHALLGPGGPGFLGHLEQLGIFVIRVGDGFEFHPLFKEFLLREFRGLPEAERRESLLRLADLAATPEERIAFLQQAGDWARAEAELVEQLPTLVAQGWQATAWEKLASFPAAWREASYRLRYVEGCLLVRESRAIEGMFLQREAERGAQAHADRDALGLIWSALSTTAALLGETEQQVRYAELGLAALPEAAAAARAICLNSRGLARLQRLDLGGAEADFLAVRELSGDAHRPIDEVHALHNLGYVAALRGDHRRAADLCREAIARAHLARALPPPHTYANLAISCICLGRAAEGQEALEEGTALAERLASTRDRAYLFFAAGLLHERQGDLERARSAQLQSLEAAEECGDRLARMWANLGLAETSLRLGNLDEAQREIARGVSASGGSLDDPELLWAAALQADLLLRRAEIERARTLLAHAGRVLERFPNPFQECSVLRLRAALCRMEGDLAGQAEHRGRMQELAERHGYAVPGEWPDPLPAVDAQASATIRIRCLGPFEVRVRGRMVEQWIVAKVKAMLAYLVLHPAGVSRQELVEAVYPEQEVSRSALHTALGRLREALEPECREGAPSRFVLFSGGRYRLNPGTPVWCDVTEFLRLLDQVAATAPETPPEWRRSLLERATQIYAGPFLPEFQYIPWVRLEAERLRSLPLKAFEDLLSLAGAADDWPALERYAEAALRVETCHHPSVRAKIVALAMQERLPEAMRYGRKIAESPCGCAVADQGLPELLEVLGTGRATARALRSFLPPLP